jgi:hypothetical protein
MDGGTSGELKKGLQKTHHALLQDGSRGWILVCSLRSRIEWSNALSDGEGATGIVRDGWVRVEVAAQTQPQKSRETEGCSTDMHAEDHKPEDVTIMDCG